MKAIEFTRASVALALCAALALVAASCEQRPVGPETEKPAGNWVKIHGWNDYYYNFSDVWAASTNEFFISARSSNDQLIHYDDASWRAEQIELETGDDIEVERLWGRSPTDLYATGSVPSYRHDALIHFDGSAWSEAAIEAREGENLHDVWGDGTGHVFAVGYQVVHHFDGTSWSRTDIPGGYFFAVWGSSASDVYAVGINAYHYDGSAWSEMEGTSDMNLHGVWGSGPNDVYAVDWNGQHEIVHFDGMEWRTAFPGDDNLVIRDIWVSSSGLVVCPGGYWTSDSGVPERAAVLYGRGDMWSRRDIGRFGELRSISGTGDGGAIMVGSSSVAIYFKDGPFEFVHPGYETHLNAVWGSAPDNVLMAADDGFVFRYDGGSLWPEKVSRAESDVNGVWGSSEDDVFAVGADGLIARFDGSAWRPMESGVAAALFDVWGSGPQDVYAVGEDFTILHFDGASWSVVDYRPDFTPWHVWGSSSDDVFVVGGGGTILHYDGRSWQKMPSGTDEWLWDVWGLSRESVFAVGSAGTLLYYDGDSWRAMKGAGLKTITVVWGTAFDNVYAASVEGTVYHFDGSLWTQIYHDSSVNLSGMWGSSPVDILGVGDWGCILRYAEE